MTNKNILFITHSNNDLDNFLPLIDILKRNSNYTISALAFYDKEILMNNKLHKYICEEFSLDTDSYSSLFIPSVIRGFGKKAIVLYSLFFLSDEAIRKFIIGRNLHLLVIDHRTVDESVLKENPIRQIKRIRRLEVNSIDIIMFRFLSVARDLGIPTLVLPHGPDYEYEIPAYSVSHDIKEPFKADYFVANNVHSLENKKSLSGIKKTMVIGNPRYVKKWIEYTEDIVSKLYAPISKPSGKVVVLYIASLISEASYTASPSYREKIHMDILSLVDNFENIEIWMKYHPRATNPISLDGIKNGDRIRFFNNSTDTNFLFKYADVVVSPKSSILLIPIMHKMPIIYYDRWKELAKDHIIRTFFDDCSFIQRASDHKMLVDCLQNILHGTYHRTTDDDIDFIYNRMNSSSLKEDVEFEYVELFKEIVE